MKFKGKILGTAIFLTGYLIIVGINLPDRLPTAEAGGTKEISRETIHTETLQSIQAAMEYEHGVIISTEQAESLNCKTNENRGRVSGPAVCYHNKVYADAERSKVPLPGEETYYVTAVKTKYGSYSDGETTYTLYSLPEQYGMTIDAVKTE